MAAASVTNTFTALSPAVASEVNRNFTDLVDFSNDSTVHRDGSKPFTGEVSMGSFKITNVSSGVAANDAVNVAQLGGALPAGFIGMYGSDVAPSAAWLLCDGAAYSRSSYSDLFAAIGTAYGVGDGATTFNVPDMGAKFPYGATAGSTGGSNDAVAIAHTHTMGTHTHTMPSHSHTANHNHTATTGSDGSHSHTIPLYNNIGADGASGANASSSSFGSQVSTNTGGDHSHSVTVATKNFSTSSVDPGNTHATDPGDTNSSGVSGTNLNRPAFVGVNFIIKSGL
jgi:microcystin-dependent protein